MHQAFLSFVPKKVIRSCQLVVLSLQDTPKSDTSFLLVYLDWSKFILSEVFGLIFNQMSEKDFWTKYFKAEYLHSTRNAIAAAAEAAEDEELAIFLKNDDILAKEAKQKVFLVEN